MKDVFQDNGEWFFCDETGTQFLGPFDNEEKATQGCKDYYDYLKSGFYPESLRKLSWQNGEEF